MEPIIQLSKSGISIHTANNHYEFIIDYNILLNKGVGLQSADVHDVTIYEEKMSTVARTGKVVY